MIEPTELINGKPIRRQGVCGVIATANVTGRTPQEVFDLFKKSRGLDCGKRCRRFIRKVWHIKNPAIDKQAASVAASPAMEKPTVTEAARQYLAEIGRKGGKNNKHQARAAQTYWARLTPAQRSEEMRKRAEKRLKNRAEKK